MLSERSARLRQLVRMSRKSTELLKGGDIPVGALFAPAAMLAGAIGLLALWCMSPLASRPAGSGMTLALVRVFYVHPGLESETEAPARAQVVLKVAQAQRRALMGVLGALGAPAADADAHLLGSPATTSAQLDGLANSERRMVVAAQVIAHARAESLRRAFRLAGVASRDFEKEDRATSGVLSPLELRNTRVLAARFDLDAGLALRLQRTARDLMSARTLERATQALPFATPVDNPVRSSSFGLRIDPFTGLTTFHPGQDFSGHFGQPVQTTAPGRVVFAGQRNGYGDCVEIDHGEGFKTRYGHLEHISVAIGQNVGRGDTIGLMGSTGRSTGVHLHYEVWRNGQLQDPARYLRAAEALQQGLG